ncbi:GNAT family N-acetyltransferase [Paenibacillus pedocola]|uniref:GNAT family N-acetyltransferase n=1 Tax=Paenibacillus pedocola TaxID=3242193 RepID=UPI00351CF7A0
MFLYGNGEVNVRSLEAEDAELLVNWLSDPSVLEYYEGRDRPHDMDRVQEHFYGEDTEEIGRGIVRYNSQDIGYVQYYPLGDAERGIYGYSGFAGSIYGMDQFIGDPFFWNRGIGSQLVKETVQYLIEVKQAGKIVMDPQCWNQRALHVYEKNGFIRKQRLLRHEWHEGELRDCWLVEHAGKGE